MNVETSCSNSAPESQAVVKDMEEANNQLRNVNKMMADKLTLAEVENKSLKLLQEDTVPKRLHER